MGETEYVVGMEPANCRVEGRAKERERILCGKIICYSGPYPFWPNAFPIVSSAITEASL